MIKRKKNGQPEGTLHLQTMSILVQFLRLAADKVRSEPEEGKRNATNKSPRISMHFRPQGIRAPVSIATLALKNIKQVGHDCYLCQICAS